MYVAIRPCIDVIEGEEANERVNERAMAKPMANSHGKGHKCRNPSLAFEAKGSRSNVCFSIQKESLAKSN